MALVEAMSWGLPVVTTSVGGAGEFLEQGSNCLLVTPGDVLGISEALAGLARDPAFRQRIRSWGELRVRQSVALALIVISVRSAEYSMSWQANCQDKILLCFLRPSLISKLWVLM